MLEPYGKGTVLRKLVMGRELCVLEMLVVVFKGGDITGLVLAMLALLLLLLCAGLGKIGFGVLAKLNGGPISLLSLGGLGEERTSLEVILLLSAAAAAETGLDLLPAAGLVPT